MKLVGKPTTKETAPWEKQFAFLPKIVSIDKNGVVTKVWFTWFESRAYIINEGRLTCRWVIEDRAIDSSQSYAIYCPTVSFYG